MDLRRCRKLLIFGGSFDPPHRAHVELPMLARHAIGADAVAYIPAAQAPHKRARVQTPARHRLAMLRLALAEVPQAVVLTDELDRAGGKPGLRPQASDSREERQSETSTASSAADHLATGPLGHSVTLSSPSYTVDTLEALHARLGPGVELRLLIGADQLRIFDSWRHYQRIIELAEPVVMVRPPDTRQALLATLPKGFAPRAWEKRILDLPAMDVSSSMIRQRIAQDQPVTGLIAPAVERYIHEHGLYQPSA